jgi:hypothetical protein
MTEFSAGDEHGEFPTFVPGTTPTNLKALLQGVVTPEQMDLARRFAQSRRGAGQSPFKEIWEK